MYVCMYVCMYVGDGGCARVWVCIAASGAAYDGVEPGHGADRAPQQQDLAPPACPYHRRLLHVCMHVCMYVLYVCMYVCMYVCTVCTVCMYGMYVWYVCMYVCM